MMLFYRISISHGRLVVLMVLTFEDLSISSWMIWFKENPKIVCCWLYKIPCHAFGILCLQLPEASSSCLTL